MERPEEFKKQDVTTKYMTFELVELKEKTSVWLIVNNKSKAVLGSIYWYPAWRQYVVGDIDGDSIFNNGCLDDISRFLTGLNMKQRNQSRLIAQNA